MKTIIILALVMMGYTHTAQSARGNPVAGTTTLALTVALLVQNDTQEEQVIYAGLDEAFLVYGGENPENLYRYQAAVNAYETLNEVDLSELSHDEAAYEIIEYVNSSQEQ